MLKEDKFLALEDIDISEQQKTFLESETYTNDKYQ